MKFAFVVPRFAEEIIGGIEALVGSLVRKLYERGDQVEVWTTCAKDNRSWQNYYQSETTKEFGVVTRRFLVSERNLETWIPLQIKLSEGHKLSIEEQLDRWQHSVTSEDLLSHIVNYGVEFDLIFFAPYLFGTTFWGVLSAPNNAALIPCLHDEADAYLETMRAVFSNSKGALFNALPEKALAETLFGPMRGGVVGTGFEIETYSQNYSPYFEKQFDYVIYVGRKETGKNAHILVDYFIEAKDKQLVPEGLKLVVVGGGSFSDLHRDFALERSDIIDIAAVSELDKLRLIEHAKALVQPSIQESFSIVLMEAWLLKTPVLVNGQGAVTRDHVVKSAGGLYFSSAEDFSGVVNYLLEDSQRAKQFAERGYDYVVQNYSWPVILERFDIAVADILEGAA